MKKGRCSWGHGMECVPLVTMLSIKACYMRFAQPDLIWLPLKAAFTAAVYGVPALWGC